jgi:hypothetical protein
MYAVSREIRESRDGTRARLTFGIIIPGPQPGDFGV